MIILPEDLIMAKKKKEIPESVVIVAIAAIAGLELAALAKGINGKALATAIGVIGLLAGASLPQIRFKK